MTAATLATRHGSRPSIARRPLTLAAMGIGALLVVLVAGVAAGSVFVPPGDTIAILAHRLVGLNLGISWTPAEETIVFDLRLPRVLTAMSVGVGLAVAGAAFQGVLRNPLADPYVLGTASGAALGAAIAVILPVRAVILEFGLLHGLAFIGALGAVFVVYRVSRVGGHGQMTSLLLTGYAVGSLLAAGLSMAMFASGAGLRQIFSYLLGGFEAATWVRFATALPLILGACGLLVLRARALNGFLLGEEAAAHLGVDVRRARDPARPRLAGDRGVRGGVGAHRVRGARGAARRAAGRRPERPPRAAPRRDLRGRADGRRGPRGAAARRYPGRRRHRGDRRAVLPAPAAPDPRRVRAVRRA